MPADEDVVVELGFDLGTTAIKLACLEKISNSLSFFSASNNAYIPSPLKYGCNVMDIRLVMDAFVSVLSQLKDYHANKKVVISKISFANQMHGIVCWSSKKPENPSPLFTWEDTHVSDEYLLRINGELASLTSQSLYPPVFRGFGIPTLLFLLEEHPELFDNSKHNAYDRCGTVGSYFSWILTNAFSNGGTINNTDNNSFLHVSDACAWGCFNIESGWANETLLNLNSGIVPLLPKVLINVEKVGQLNLNNFDIPSRITDVNRKNFKTDLFSQLSHCLSKFTTPSENCPIFVSIGDHTACMITIREYFQSSQENELPSVVSTTNSTTVESSNFSGERDPAGPNQLCVVNIGTSSQIAILPLRANDERGRSAASEMCNFSSNYIEMRPIPRSFGKFTDEDHIQMSNISEPRYQETDVVDRMAVGAGMNGGNILGLFASTLLQSICENWTMFERKLDDVAPTTTYNTAAECVVGSTNSDLRKKLFELRTSATGDTLPVVYSMLSSVSNVLCDPVSRTQLLSSICQDLLKININVHSPSLINPDQNFIAPQNEVTNSVDLGTFLPLLQAERAPIGYSSNFPPTSDIMTNATPIHNKRDAIRIDLEDHHASGALTLDITSLEKKFQALIDLIFAKIEVAHDAKSKQHEHENEVFHGRLLSDKHSVQAHHLEVLDSWVLLCKLFGILFYETIEKITSRLVDMIPESIIKSFRTIVPLGGALQKNHALLKSVIENMCRARMGGNFGETETKMEQISLQGEIDVFTPSNNVMAHAGAIGALLASRSY